MSSDAAVDMFRRIGVANVALSPDDERSEPTPLPAGVTQPKPEPPQDGPTLLELLFRSRRYLADRYCSRQIHVHRWWHWRDHVRFSAGVGSVDARGWVSYCEVCRTAYRHDPNTPRGDGRSRRVA